MIKRVIFDELKDHLEKKEITLITGPRQAGKTTVMLLLKRYLEAQDARTVFLNLDIEADKYHFDSQEKLLRKVELEIGKSNGYVFIDEIQRKENAGVFLKGLYDMDLPYKFIVSGSGSLELKEKIHESLAGRKRLFELNPVSFEEFVNFKTDYRYDGKLQSFFIIEPEKTNQFLDEYLNFGGYPRVILEETLIEKRNIINEIFRSYLEKDISYLLRVEKVDAFSKMINLLADQIGNLINYSELAGTLGLSMATITNYLRYAEKTFIIKLLPPYFKNKRKEIVKSPVVYFCDLGLRNYAVGVFGTATQAASGAGFLFQNFIFHLLAKKIESRAAALRFWRSKDGAEVDFVINEGKKVVPVEVKYKRLQAPSVERSMRSFVEKYEPEEAWVINLSLKQNIQIGSTIVKFIPFYEVSSVDIELP